MVDAYRALVAKKEVTYATDAAPTVAANAILTRNFSAVPVVTDPLERNLDLPSRGGTAVAATNERTTLSFEVELAGSGAAGTAPGWMDLLEGCTFAAPVLTEDTSAAQSYAAVGDALSSLSMYHWAGNQRRKVIGARGDVSTIDLTAGAYPFLSFAYTGLLPAIPFDVNQPAGLDYARWIQPLEVNTLNTSIDIGGYSPVMQYLRLQANTTVAVRNLVGANYVQAGNHNLTGKLMIEAVSVDQKNMLADVLSGATQTMTITHGTVAGNIVELAAAAVQLTAVAESNSDDILMQEFDVRLNIGAGSDDLIFTAR